MARPKGSKDSYQRTRKSSPEGYKRGPAMLAKMDATVKARQAVFDAANPGWRERLAEFNKRIMERMYRPIGAQQVPGAHPDTSEST